MTMRLFFTTSKFFLAAVFGLAALRSSAATIVWTNLDGGDWGNKESWSPNEVPDGLSYEAVITNSGNYTVVFDADRQLASFALGGASGMQRLVNSNFYSLTFQGAGNIR